MKILARAVVVPFMLSFAMGCGGGGGPVADGATNGDANPIADASHPIGNVDPMCTDGMYSESIPSNTTSLSSVTFTGDIPAFVHAALSRRYPFGDTQVAGGEMDTTSGDCAVVFAGNPTSASDLYGQLDVIVHECGHIQDGRMSPGIASNGYVINPTLTLTCSRGDTTTRGGDTFARSRLNTDTFAHLRPACAADGTGIGCDFYAPIYLSGNPDDATFDSGDQGFNMLLEEAVQYVNSLVTGYEFEDQRPRGESTSDRDGILTMLWYVERYLHDARLNFPSAYSRLSTDACWRTAILTVWGRAWLYLGQTRNMSLGLDDAALEALVNDATLLDEIQRIRTLAGCQ